MNHIYTQKKLGKSQVSGSLYNKVSTNETGILNRQKSSLYNVVLFFLGGILFTPTLWSQSFLHDMKSRFRFVQPSQGTLISGFAPMIELEGVN